jgi:hypothetical protein
MLCEINYHVSHMFFMLNYRTVINVFDRVARSPYLVLSTLLLFAKTAGQLNNVQDTGWTNKCHLRQPLHFVM